MSRRKVVVTGMGLITSVGLDTESCWRALLAGRSGVAPIRGFDTEGFRTRIAAEVTDFDPEPVMNAKDARKADRYAQVGQCVAQVGARRALGVVGPQQAGERGAAVRPAGLYSKVGQQGAQLGGGREGDRRAVERELERAEQRERQSSHRASSSCTCAGQIGNPRYVMPYIIPHFFAEDQVRLKVRHGCCIVADRPSFRASEASREISM